MGPAVARILGRQLSGGYPKSISASRLCPESANGLHGGRIGSTPVERAAEEGGFVVYRGFCLFRRRSSVE